MTLKLNGSSSGYTAIDAPATAGSNTLVLPPNNGNNGDVLTTNGSGTMTWAASSANCKIESSNATSLSGSQHHAFAVSAGCEMIIVTYEAVTTTDNAKIEITLGHGSTTYITSGYYTNAAKNPSNDGWHWTTTDHMQLNVGMNSNSITQHGQVILHHTGNNKWTAMGQHGGRDNSLVIHTVHTVDMGSSNTLTSLRLSTESNNFTGGTARYTGYCQV